MHKRLRDAYQSGRNVTEEVTLRTIRDLENLARTCPGIRVNEVQHAINLLRSSLPYERGLNLQPW